MASKKYTVKMRVDHDNTPYEIDSEIELDDASAEALLSVKAIAASEKISVPKATDTPAPTASVKNKATSNKK